MTNHETREAQKAASLQPMSPEFIETVGDEGLRSIGLGNLSSLGDVLEETLEWEIKTRAALGGVVLPWEFDGMQLPDDFVMVRFAAYVTPNDENKKGRG